MAVAEGLVLHLDKEQKAKLEEVAKAREIPVPELMHRLIDEAYEESMIEKRLQLVREMAEMELEDVPDPETLNRQSESTYGASPLY